MLLAPGGTGSVVFNVSLAGSLSDIGTPIISILRNGIVTTVPVTIDNTVVGRYVGTFTVPANWVGYDKADALFELTYGDGGSPKTIECSKSVGVIGAAGLDDLQEINIDRIIDLMEADQVFENGMMTYYLKDSNQTIVLHQQNYNGDSACADNTSLTSS